MELAAVAVQIVIGVIIVAPVLWLSGRALVGRQKAKFTDAIWTVVLGVVVGAIVGAFVGGLLGALITFVLWLYLIKHFFDCGWVKALVVAVVAVIIFVAIIAILAVIGIGLLILL